MLPDIPVDKYYILIDGVKEGISRKLPGDPEINCGSDVHTFMVNCCERYNIFLMVSFNGGSTGPMRLDSTDIRVKPENGCVVVDVDPNHD